MRDPSKANDPIEVLLGAESRGDLKAGGAFLDGGGRALRAALVAAARARGADIDDDWAEMDGKRLLRQALHRADAAQVRKNPIHRDEAFVCGHCGREVPEGGRRPRDHCPWCLHSRHVDVVPGDRAAACGGLLVPYALAPSSKGLQLQYRCVACGAERVNRVLDDLEVPDDPRALRSLTQPR